MGADKTCPCCYVTMSSLLIVLISLANGIVTTEVTIVTKTVIMATIIVTIVTTNMTLSKLPFLSFPSFS